MPGVFLLFIPLAGANVQLWKHLFLKKNIYLELSVWEVQWEFWLLSPQKMSRQYMRLATLLVSYEGNIKRDCSDFASYIAHVHRESQMRFFYMEEWRPISDITPSRIMNIFPLWSNIWIHLSFLLLLYRAVHLSRLPYVLCLRNWELSVSLKAWCSTIHTVDSVFLQWIAVQ